MDQFLRASAILFTDAARISPDLYSMRFQRLLTNENWGLSLKPVRKTRQRSALNAR